MSCTVCGIILVGGGSRRLGRDKRTLEVDGLRNVTRIVRAVRPLVTDVRLVGGEEGAQEADTVWVPDLVAGAGPLGGIISGLRSTDAEWTLVLACDTPLVSTAVLRCLVDAIPASSPPVAVVPRLAGRPEPLVALYSRAALAPLQVALERGERALHRILASLDVRYLDEAVLRSVDPTLDAFLNVNTEADLQRLVAKLTLGRGNDTL